MLIAYAFSFIGILLVYGNYKLLRYNAVLIATLVLTILLAAAGMYLISVSDMDNPYILMVMVSPLAALLLLEWVRWVYRRARGQEIILYMGGFLPKRFEERFVTPLEKLITLLITALALVLAYLAVMLVASLA